ncbi:division/cell wall cluster transcriptional repressor MraZ [Thermostilla marina]
MPLLTGQYTRAIDDKQRIAMPKRLRDAFGTSKGDHLYVSPGLDGSLSVYDEASLSAFADRLANASPTNRDVRDFTRIFYALTEVVEIDSQGRIRIPQNLIELAGMTKEVVLVGARDHVEIWAAQRWREYLAAKQPAYDRIAESAFEPRPNTFGCT